MKETFKMIKKEVKSMFVTLLWMGALASIVYYIWWFHQPHKQKIDGHEYIKIYEYNGGEEILHSPECKKCKSE